MKYFFENDLFLEYEFIRAEGKQTLLFLNGLTQSYEVWKNCVSRFQQNYQFILVDLVNQGKSSSITEKKDFDQHAAILKKLVDHLNINEIFVAGATTTFIFVNSVNVLSQHQVFSTIAGGKRKRKVVYHGA